MSSEQRKVATCIIDDDPIFIYGFKKLLQLKGLQAKIQAFGNGEEAIDFLKDPRNHDNLPDIIFIDINMPVMDGWEFTRVFEEIQSQ